MRTSPSGKKKNHFFNEEHQKISQNYVISVRFKRNKFLSVCGLNLKLSSYRSLLSRKTEVPDGITLTAYLWHFLHISRTGKRLDLTSEPKELVTTWHFTSFLLSQPRPPSVHVYRRGILSKPPWNLLHSQSGYHMAEHSTASFVLENTSFFCFKLHSKHSPLFPCLLLFYKLNNARTNCQFTSSSYITLTSSCLDV